MASYAASKSLIFVIDDLLNLTGSLAGSIVPLCDPFDIAGCMEEVLHPLKRLAREKTSRLSRVPRPASRATCVATCRASSEPLLSS